MRCGLGRVAVSVNLRVSGLVVGVPVGYRSSIAIRAALAEYRLGLASLPVAAT